MERIIFKNSRGLRLVGILEGKGQDSIVIMSHGFTGDKSEWGRFDEIASLLNEEGLSTFRFDFSGCGESDDDTLTVEKQVDDLHSAISHFRSRGFNRIALYGHSLGGLVSFRCYSSDIMTIAATAPVTERSSRFSPEQMAQAEKLGYIEKIRDKGVRRRILIDAQMIIDRSTVDQEQLLRQVKCPVLIVHGKKDESVPCEDSKRAMQFLPRGSQLITPLEMDHSNYAKIPRCMDALKRWFCEHLL